MDVLIVGSGPTGAAYARTIADAAPQASILVIEAGPVITDPPGMHTANITDPEERQRAEIASQGPTRYPYPAPPPNTPSRRATRPRDEELLSRAGLFRLGSGQVGGDGFPAAQAASNVGGMGSLWFGACPRPSPQERISCVDPEVLDQAYSLAEHYLNVSATQFGNSRFAAHVREVVGAVVNPGRRPDRWVQAMPLAATVTGGQVRRSGADVVFGDLLQRRDTSFELRPRTRCTRLLMDGTRAIGAEIQNLRTGTSTTVTAAAVVVAADALRTPQLLFASGIRPPALGHYLDEHPQVAVMARVTALALSPHPAELGVTATMAAPGARTVPASGVTWLPYGGDDFPYHGNLVEVDPASLAPSDGAQADPTPVLSIHLFLPQEPRFDNRVEFSETVVDWAGLPAMRFHVTLSDRDRDTVRRAGEVALRIGSALGGTFDEELSPLPAGSSLHYQGTVRMGGENDGRSVCDPSCRVWSTDNLFVAGNGVIPTMTACNPTLTSVALATIGGRQIVEQLRSRARADAAAGAL